MPYTHLHTLTHTHPHTHTHTQAHTHIHTHPNTTNHTHLKHRTGFQRLTTRQASRVDLGAQSVHGGDAPQPTLVPNPLGPMGNVLMDTVPLQSTAKKVSLRVLLRGNRGANPAPCKHTHTHAQHTYAYTFNKHI